MVTNSTRTSLAAVFVGITLIGVALSFWTNSFLSEWAIIVTGAVLALIAALFTPFGMKFGAFVGVGSVFIACIAIEKDPSGLGPLEFILPIQLILSAVPIAVGAWIGAYLRHLLSPM